MSHRGWGWEERKKTQILCSLEQSVLAGGDREAAKDLKPQCSIQLPVKGCGARSEGKRRKAAEEAEQRRGLENDRRQAGLGAGVSAGRKEGQRHSLLGGSVRARERGKWLGVGRVGGREPQEVALDGQRTGVKTVKDLTTTLSH